MTIPIGFERDGFVVLPEIINPHRLRLVLNRIVGQAIYIGARTPAERWGHVPNVDVCWRVLCDQSRDRAGLLYNAMKHDSEIKALSVDVGLLSWAGRLLGGAVAITDVNFRIDAPGENQYLFGWHQDHWYQQTSPDAIVAWIPLMDCDDEVGGVELLPGRRLLKCKRNPESQPSYANLFLLDGDEDVDLSQAVKVYPKAGDALLFRFDVLHRSLPNVSMNRCRWTVQVRMVSMYDQHFMERGFRPTEVSR